MKAIVFATVSMPARNGPMHRDLELVFVIVDLSRRMRGEDVVDDVGLRARGALVVRHDFARELIRPRLRALVARETQHETRPPVDGGDVQHRVDEDAQVLEVVVGAHVAQQHTELLRRDALHEPDDLHPTTARVALGDLARERDELG